MELKHANGEQMTVEKLISFVLAEKRSFFKDWKSNPMEFNRNSPNLQFRKGGWREKLLYSRREIEDSSF